MNDDEGVSQEVDKWWASVAKLKHKEDRSQVFPHLSKLALGLCTVYNSSSPAERDFTVQSHIYADKRVHKLGQKKLVAKTTLRSSVRVTPGALYRAGAPYISLFGLNAPYLSFYTIKKNV